MEGLNVENRLGMTLRKPDRNGIKAKLAQLRFICQDLQGWPDRKELIFKGTIKTQYITLGNILI